MAEFAGAARPLSPDGFTRVLDTLGVGAPELWTVLSVETKGFGYLVDRRPLILFERHIFSRRTNGVYDASNPTISSPKPGGYAGGAAEYNRLAAAVALDRNAALNSTSWGIGQVMGFNSSLAGYPVVEAMVDAMVASEDAQLAAMANFVRAQGFDGPLRNHDWAGFARGYNGPDFAKNQYDTRLASFYQKFSAGPVPDLQVRQAQALLTFLGIDPNGVDGILGKRTRGAVVQFREQNSLGDSDEIDDALIAALRAQVQAAAAAA
jgi:N-acetylmuramidase-like protein/putative peptidoglycan binding protein